MKKQALHPTAQRVLVRTLFLYNCYGEHNVSTTTITKDLGISPGNLYYHFASKDDITNALFDQHTLQVSQLLSAVQQIYQLEDTWFILHSLFENIWIYRFIYRDSNDLISRNRYIEVQSKQLMQQFQSSMQRLLHDLHFAKILNINTSDIAPLSTQMVMVLMYWINLDNALHPRDKSDMAAQNLHLVQGARQLLWLLKPYVQEMYENEHMALMDLYIAGEADLWQA